jgi:hypothetical protein
VWASALVPRRLVNTPFMTKKHLDEKLFFRWFTMPLHTRAYWGFGPFAEERGYKRSSISLGVRRGRCSFNDVVHIPQIVRTGRDETVVMSLSPMEILTQRPGIKRARGKVLIGGLGMGWLARRVCEKRTVHEVTVCDISQTVIDAFAFEHPKLRRIRCSDVWNASFDMYDSVLLDIWDSYGYAEGQRELVALKQKHPRVWAWGDVTTLGNDSLW